MKIEAEIDPSEFVKLVAREYAQILFDRYERQIFHFTSDVSKMVKAKALKVFKADAKFNKTIEDLLKDKEFIKQSVSKIIEEATKDAMRSDEYD